MKVFVLFLILLSVQNVFSSTRPEFLSPQPNSKYNKTYTAISLRYKNKSAVNFTNENSISVKGSKSGNHDYTIKIGTDNQTIIIAPVNKFSTDETVSVKIYPVTKNGEALYFSFQTEEQELKSDALNFLKEENGYNTSSNKNYQPQARAFSDDTLPGDFPVVTVTNSIAPSPGYIFLSNFSLINGDAPAYLMILNNAAHPVYFKKLDSAAYDFKKQPNGNLTYYYSLAHKFYEMNPSYQVIDSFSCGNGYSTDLHELRMLNNGHVLLMSYDPQIVNMRNYIENGDSTATVVGLIIQELDENKNVVFQWRSWDHFQITDATHEVLTAAQIDYVHGNALEMDTDGNILLSSRHLDEITKINRTNGSIIWRLGGKNNEFVFTNDTVAFSHQHCIRRIANGNITLFDNGNFRGRMTETNIHEENSGGSSPTRELEYSRACEYHLDEVNLTATLVWQYRNNLATYGYAMGSVERLENGNTIIGWGATNPTMTEVTPQGEKVFELSFAGGTSSYRAFRDIWDVAAVAPSAGETQIPKAFNLYQNYPNPFNPSTSIKFDIPKESLVKINIYNLIGQKVQEVNEGELAPGSYDYIWNAGSFASGIYFYQIETNSFTETKRMILLK